MKNIIFLLIVFVAQIANGQSFFAWDFSCSHQPAEPSLPITEAYNEIQSEGFTIDRVSILGDFHVAGYDVEGDDQTTNLVQTDLLSLNGLTVNVTAGNHDTVASSAWFRQTFPATPWPHYSTEFGNVVEIWLHDRNDLPYPWGGLNSTVVGGHPSGAITLKTLIWMQGVIAIARANQKT